jgi:HK97 family phage portal protein
MNVLDALLQPFRKSAAPVERVEPLSLTATAGWTDEAWAGETVDTANVLALSTAWACVNLIAGTIGTLPLMVYRTDKKGGRTVARDHNLFSVLHDTPNADQTPVDFMEFISANIELQGNGFARKIKATIGEKRGQVIGLVPLRADIVDVRRAPDGVLRYRFTEYGKPYDLPQDDVLHIRGFGGGPEGGLSTLTYGRHTFSLAQALDRSAGGMFRNGIRPSVVISYKDWLTREQRDQVDGLLEQKYIGSVNAGRPFVAEGGMTVSPLSMTPEDAQMLESRGLSVEEVCRFFGVPPIMVGHGEKTSSWGTGIQEITLGFIKFTLRRRLSRIEQALRKQLLTADDVANGITIEFNLEGLLRGDSKARSEFYRTMAQIGGMTINEIRQLENLPPVDGGDVVRLQMQNVPIDQADKEPTDVPQR